jgi:hypothetical protein
MKFKKYDGPLILIIFAIVFLILGFVFSFYDIFNSNTISYPPNAIENSED